MKNLVKILWKGVNLLSVVVFVIMLLYYFFRQHDGVNARSFDDALMFFMGMSVSTIITFSKNAYTFTKNSELANQIKNSINERKSRQQIKLEKLQQEKEELKKVADNGNNTNSETTA